MAAFQARIGEKFDERKLRQAFVARDYLETEYLRKKSLGITDEVEGEASSSSSSSESSSDDEGHHLTTGAFSQVFFAYGVDVSISSLNFVLMSFLD